VQIEYAEALSFDISHPLMPTLCAALGYTQYDLETLFTYASSI
jgi:hypothetical protein